MLLIAIATYIMNVYDMICTMYLVKEYGEDIEGNPLGKVLLKNKPITVIIKLVCMACVLLLLYLFNMKVLQFVMFGIYCILTVYHTVILIYLKAHHL